MIATWLTANAVRILVYLGMITALAMMLELDGFRRGSAKLDEYINNQLRATVTLVAKARKVDADEFDNLQADYNVLYSEYIRLHHDAASRGAGSLASAAASLSACPKPDSANPTGNDPMQSAERLLADVENAVLAILETGDTEIVKYRRLAKRDIAIGNITK